LLCAGSYDHFLNFQIVFIIMLQLAMCIFCAVASYIWRNHSGWPRYQLAMYAYVQGNYENGAAYTFILLITFWILYSYLVPISLFVTMEIVKFWQVRASLKGHPLWQLSRHASIWPSMHFGNPDLRIGLSILFVLLITFWGSVLISQAHFHLRDHGDCQILVLTGPPAKCLFPALHCTAAILWTLEEPSNYRPLLGLTPAVHV